MSLTKRYSSGTLCILVEDQTKTAHNGGLLYAEVRDPRTDLKNITTLRSSFSSLFSITTFGKLPDLEVLVQ